MANFLADLFETGLEYRTLNSYRSSISAFHKTGHSILTGRHPLVTPLMKEAGNSRPPTPRITLFGIKNKSLNILVVSLQTANLVLIF